MLHHVMNEYEQVNCVTKKNEARKKRRGGKKSNRANPRQIVTQNTIKFRHKHPLINVPLEWDSEGYIKLMAVMAGNDRNKSNSYLRLHFQTKIAQLFKRGTT